MAKARIIIKLRTEILDPEGEAVANAIKRSGIATAQNVRVAKIVELELDDQIKDADEVLNRIADKVLVNPVMQDYEIEWL